ncbi:hypothetical protein SOVF_143090 [Spinacia oleracea]|uniref:gibberellin 2beta-dioxygenase n=1 Tax=Spinacia oleracea TaxID=3562 RepID=Q8GSN6_SPIOL|nr:gibberellin 2-beta-dioxygenase [Spinacia oleracea]AAN87571.1 gibberellin 2-oxidase 1 [Spinacia oleracea]KNA10532.1 hypothetical protein SOVF_143090 [Spinacia oleracea]
MVVLSHVALDQFMKTCKPIDTHLFPTVIPTIDLNSPDVKSLIVKACKEFGFFKVVNHGVPIEMTRQLEDEASKFFSLPQGLKESAGNPNPFGYGNKKIGRNGDVGWIEYLLLSASDEFISQTCLSIYPDNPDVFRCALNNYISKMKKMGVRVLETMAEGLNLKGEDRYALSNLIKDSKSDSYFRLNHYPPRPEAFEGINGRNLVGFGEHTDPQIISVLRSNKIGGLQISLNDGTWVSVPPDDNSFFILVGDSLQVMTNGRFKSVKHRVLADNMKSRLSMIFFAGPPLCQKIAPLPCIMQKGEESLYEEFTWCEYKKSAYKSRLSENRLLRFVKRNHN